MADKTFQRTASTTELAQLQRRTLRTELSQLEQTTELSQLEEPSFHCAALLGTSKGELGQWHLA